MPWSPTTLTTSSRNCATSATQIVVPIRVSMCTPMLPIQKSATLIPIASIHQPVLKQLVLGLLRRKSSLVFVQIIQLSHLPLSIIIIIIIPLNSLFFSSSSKQSIVQSIHFWGIALTPLSVILREKQSGQIKRWVN